MKIAKEIKIIVACWTKLQKIEIFYFNALQDEAKAVVPYTRRLFIISEWKLSPVSVL